MNKKLVAVTLLAFSFGSGCSFPQPVVVPPAVVSPISISAIPVQSLAAYQDSEVIFADSEMISQAETSFTTKANMDFRWNELRKNIKTKTEELKKDLRDTGVASLNNDGSIDIDQEKLRNQIKMKLAASLNKIQKILDQNQNKLQMKKELSSAGKGKLNRKNNIIHTSDVVEVKNDDGTVTKIITIEFENSKTGMKKTNKVLNTFSAEGKLIKKEHYLTLEQKNFSRTATRIMTFNPDGTITVDTEVKTTWTSGKVSETTEHRVIKADGTAEGTGSVAVTENGKTTNFHLSLNLASDGASSIIAETEGNNPNGPEKVLITKNPDGTVTVTVTDEGKTETKNIDLEDDLQA